MQPKVLVLSLFAACGGTGSNNVAPSDASADSPSSGCEARAAYPDFGSNVRGYAYDYPAKTSGSATTTHAQVVVQTLDATDVMYLELDAGFGGFGSGEIAPGTYELRGNELAPSLCGICVYVWPQSLNGTSLDGVDSDYLLNQRYIAVAGTVRLTTAGGSANGSNTISGSVSDLSFEHAIIEPDGSFTYAADGCTTSIGSGAFGPYKLAASGSGSGSAAPSHALKLRHRLAE